MYPKMRPRGLFGSTIPTQSDDPSRGGLGGNLPQTAQEAPDKHANLRRIIGIAGDFAAGLAGRAGPYAAMQEQRRQEAEQLAREQRQMAQQYALYDYKLAHPAPVNNDTVADYEFIRQNLGDDAAKEFLKNKANPPQYRQGPDGNFYRIDTGGTAPPTAPVGKLTILPEQGGGAVSGTGMFP